jgi:hypothetical protein
MPRVATKLTPAKHGGFTARKRIPVDVQDAYERLYGKRCEERFNSGPVALSLATAKMREWLTEIECRIANVRAERSGTGQELTPIQARGLAGEWYLWFTARHLARNRTLGHWELQASAFYDDFQNGAWDGSGEAWDERDPLELWQGNAKARERVRPVVADYGETSQFLHAKRLTLEPSTRDLFLDDVSRDLFEALVLLKRRANGDYGEDLRPLQFPKLDRTPDPNLTPWKLFEQWVSEVKPADSTVDRWQSVFRTLHADFPVAAAMTTEEAQAWARGLIGPDRQARTVSEVWVIAARTIFGWARGQRLLTQAGRQHGTARTLRPKRSVRS